MLKEFEDIPIDWSGEEQEKRDYEGFRVVREEVDEEGD